MNIAEPKIIFERLEKHRLAYEGTFPNEPIPPFRITYSENILLNSYLFSLFVQNYKGDEKQLNTCLGVELEVVGNPL